MKKSSIEELLAQCKKGHFENEEFKLLRVEYAYVLEILGLDRNDIACILEFGSRDELDKIFKTGTKERKSVITDKLQKLLPEYLDDLGLATYLTKENILFILKYYNIETKKNESVDELLLSLPMEIIYKNNADQLLFLLRSIDESRKNPRKIKEVELNILLRQSVNFRGTILAGDGMKKYYFDESGRKYGKIPMEMYLENKRWEKQIMSDSLLEMYFKNIILAAGWYSFLTSCSENKWVWNGGNYHIEDISYLNRDEDQTAVLNIQGYWVSYVAHLGSNYFAWQERRKTDPMKTFCDKYERYRIANEIEEKFQTINEKGLFKNQEDIDEIQKTIVFLRDEWVEYVNSNIQDYIKQALLEEQKNFKELKLSRMANLLSCNITYVTQDNYVIIQKRGNKTGHAADYKYQISAAGFVALPGDNVKSGGIDKINILETTLTETMQELGKVKVSVDMDTLIYNGVLRDETNAEVGVLAQARLSGFAEQNWDCWDSEKNETLPFNPAIEHNQAEVDGYVLVPYNARDVFDFILAEASNRKGVSMPWNDFMPLGAASLIFALVRRENGWERIKQIWSERVKIHQQSMINKHTNN